VYKGRQVMWLH